MIIYLGGLIEYICWYFVGLVKVVFLLDGLGDIGFKEIKLYKLFVKDVYENLNIFLSGIIFGFFVCGSRYYI